MFNQIWYVKTAVYALFTVSSAISTGLYRRNKGVEGIKLHVYYFYLREGFLALPVLLKREEFINN